MELEQSATIIEIMSIPFTHEMKLEEVPNSREGVRILKIVGPLTINNFFPLQDLSRKDASKVLILDMEETPVLDAAALGSIIGTMTAQE